MRKKHAALVFALQATLKVDHGNASRLARQFEMLATKYRKNVLRAMDGAHVESNIEKTGQQIADLCDRLSIDFTLMDDPREPSLRLMLDPAGNSSPVSLARAFIVEDNL